MEISNLRFLELFGNIWDVFSDYGAKLFCMLLTSHDDLLKTKSTWGFFFFLAIFSNFQYHIKNEKLFNLK